MTRRTKSLLHSSLGPCKNVAASPHGSSDQYRLACQLVIHRNQRMMRRKSSRRSLWMRTIRFNSNSWYIKKFYSKGFLPFYVLIKSFVSRRRCVPRLWRCCEIRRISRACPSRPETCWTALQMPEINISTLYFLGVEFIDAFRYSMSSIRVSVAHLPTEKSHRASIDPGEISRGSHWLQVILSLLRINVRASQLSVVGFYIVSFHSFFHLHKSVWKQN